MERVRVQGRRLHRLQGDAEFQCSFLRPRQALLVASLYSCRLWGHCGHRAYIATMTDELTALLRKASLHVRKKRNVREKVEPNTSSLLPLANNIVSNLTNCHVDIDGGLVQLELPAIVALQLFAEREVMDAILSVGEIYAYFWAALGRLEIHRWNHLLPILASACLLASVWSGTVYEWPLLRRNRFSWWKESFRMNRLVVNLSIWSRFGRVMTGFL